MLEFRIWIAGTNNETAQRWYNLFSRERFHTVRISDLRETARAGECRGILFAEIGAEGLAAPRDLGALLGGRRDLSVIVFSAPGRTGNDLISGFLENGADDFITTDIDDKVLLAKTKAHMRRLLPSLNSARTVLVSRNGEVEVDKLKRSVKTGFGSRKEKAVDGLTPKEFDIFALLLSKEEEVVPRSFLMAEIWKEKSGEVNCETIDKHIESLRRKLGVYGKHIRTVYGSGYTYKSGE